MLPKIYGPQIIPKRQRTFPSERFPLVQSAPRSTRLRAEHACASSVCSGGPRGGPAHTTHAAHILSGHFCLTAAPPDSSGGSPSPAPPASPTIRITVQDTRSPRRGEEGAPTPLLYKMLSPLKLGQAGSETKLLDNGSPVRFMDEESRAQRSGPRRGGAEI